jgi:hypothetical protein
MMQKKTCGPRCLLAACAALSVVSLPVVAGEWPMFGQNVSNTATSLELAISSRNVSKLKPR